MNTPSPQSSTSAPDWPALAAGDSAALERVMQEHQEALLRYSYALLRNASHAEDVVQETFIRLVRHARGGQNPVHNLRAWLYRVAHNLALDHWRRGRRTEPLDDLSHASLADEQVSSPADTLARRDAGQQAWAMLELLNERERQIVLLKVMERRSYQEIAEIMELTPTNVGFILHTALKKLATTLRPRLA